MKNKLVAAPVDKRIVAGLIDLLILGVVFVVMALFFGDHTATHAGNNVNYSLNLNGMGFVAYLLVIFIYYVTFEYLRGGSPGKLALGLKVVSIATTGKPTLSQIVQRNLLRVVDGFPYFIPYAVGLAMMSASPKRMRIGDNAAQTLVIQTDR